MKIYKVWEVYKNGSYMGHYLENEKALAEQFAKDIDGEIKEAIRATEV